MTLQGNMTPERWAQVEKLYHAALALPPNERAAFLTDACDRDEALRREVESLVNEPVSDGGFFAEPAAAHVVSDVAPPMIGRSLGGYQLQGLLGAGGMGQVYRARDTKLGRDVAIKILPPAFTTDPDRLARFEREARMLAALNHPNICAIYGLEEDASATPDQTPVRFLILELVDGATLAETLAARRAQSRGSGLPVRDALGIARQISDALEAAHDKGIIHRDLKPANVNVTPAGVVKVLDFGLAKPAAAHDSTQGLTHVPTATRGGRRAGVILGTAAYMSPEQARGMTVDKRTDIWAFGCVLYEMLTGRLAFPADTLSDSIVRILEHEPDWSALPDATPAAVRRLLIRMLAKDPKQRLRDIGDFRIEMEALDTPLLATRASSGLTRWRWRTAAALVIVVLGLVAGFGRWRIRSTSEPPSFESLLAQATFTPLTNFEGSELDADISPDGNFVAFLADRDGPFHVWLSRIGTGLFENLTPGAGDVRNAGLLRGVGFSAGGSAIWLNGTAGRRLMLTPLLGGGAPRAFLDGRAVNVAWSKDGTRLVYFTYDPGDPLFVADGTGGNPQKIFIGETGEVHNHYPAWSPDGRWIYYAHGFQSGSEYDVWRIPSSGGTPERLTRHNSDVRYVTTIDDRTVVYVAPDEDRSGPWLWALDVERKVTRRVSIGLERYLSVAASADGHRLVASVGTSTADLWSVPILNRLADERDVAPYPLPTARALAPRFAAPSSLYYLSSSGQGDGLWRYQDGKAVEIWKGSDGVLVESPSVSPFGDQVAVVFTIQGRRHLTLVSADGANHHSLADGIDIRGTSAWSPNGKSIVTGGNDAQGPGLFTIPVDGGPAVRLVDGPAFDPVWSPDGTLIVYVGQQRANAQLMAVRPDRGKVNLPQARVPVGGGGRCRFLPNGKDLVFLQGQVGTQDFWLMDVTTGEVRQLTRLSNSAVMNAFDITPDGKRIVFDRVREHSDIRLIDLPK